MPQSTEVYLPASRESTAEVSRTEALEYFRANNFGANCVRSWTANQPLYLSQALSYISGLSPEEISNWEKTLNDGPITYQKVARPLRSLSGITFEYLAQAHLDTTTQFRNQRFVAVNNDLFDDLITALSINPDIEISPNQKPDGFSGRLVFWKNRRLVIPDGLIVNERDQTPEISGLFETKMNTSFLRMDGIGSFIKFLRENPTTTKVVLGILELEDAAIVPNSEFQYKLLVSTNMGASAIRDYNNHGWEVEAIPFSYHQTSFQTVRILNHLLKLKAAGAYIPAFKYPR